MKPWRALVVGDEVLSDATGRWYTVQRMANLDDGSTKIQFQDVNKVFQRPGDTAAKVRRGPDGAAADLLATVFPGTEIIESGSA